MPKCWIWREDLDTGNRSYRTLLWRMGGAAGPSLFYAWEMFDWCRRAVRVSPLAACVRRLSREGSSFSCCSWHLIIIIIYNNKMAEGDAWELEHMPYVDKLRNLVLFTLRKWRLWGTWKKAPTTYGDVTEKMEPGSSWQCVKMRVKRCKLEQKRFMHFTREKLFSHEALKQWSKLFKDILHLLCLWIFKTLFKRIKTW